MYNICTNYFNMKSLTYLTYKILFKKYENIASLYCYEQEGAIKNCHPLSLNSLHFPFIWAFMQSKQWSKHNVPNFLFPF